MDNEHRRLSDKIMAAHRQACDEEKIMVAEQLLKALEIELSEMGGGGAHDKRQSMAELEEAFRLHAEAEEKAAS